MVKILFTADIQVKNREKSLYKGQEKSLLEIEKKLKETKAEIYLAAGDFWEFPNPNDSERKLIYNHLARVLAIKTVKEVVLIAGNHDLEKEKKQLDTQIGFNPINIFADFVSNFDDTLSNKITYLRDSKIYQSKTGKIEWVAYSLEDEESWRPLDGITRRHPAIDILDKNEPLFVISVYHDILRDYVDQTKLPIRKEKYNKLVGIDDFAGNLILAGDIHENYKLTSADNKKVFMYPGSPIQHTHNEGRFIRIKEKQHGKNNFDTDKYVKLITIDDDKLTWESEDLTLTNYICYNTIIFDNVSVEKCIENLEAVLDNIEFGEEQTFIKVKLSNILLTKEIDINCILQNLSMNHKRVQINFAYDKFIDLSNSENQGIINEIHSEVQTEIDNKNVEDKHETTIDDLILDNKKLNKLFDKVLDNYIPSIQNDLSSDITEEEIRDTITKLFDEQLSGINSVSQKYNILLESIETNNFMKLGPNRIDLNLPGTVKITGTNGVGKTTLFRMIRWVLKDETFDGLKKSSKIKNTLIIFNDKKAEDDIVYVKLFILINNVPITIVRTATRKWKKGITLKQKQSLRWKEYISTVDKTITVTVHKKEELVYTFEQAEKAINLWFGDTISSILFLNQSKIERILNLSSMELKELILNYIGVDYLEKLENNLDLIKGDYELTKPKRDKESIREAIVDQRICLKKISTSIDETNISITTSNDFLDKLKYEKSQIINNQISIGDIPELISEKQKEITTKQTLLDSFEEQSPKDKIVFNIEKPIIQEQILKDCEFHINEGNNKKDILDIRLVEIKKLINSEYWKLNNYVEIKISNETTKFDEVIKDLEVNHKSKNICLIADKFKIIQIKLKGIVDSLELNKDEISKVIQHLRVKRSELAFVCEGLKTQIKSGICKECSKPLSDNWEITKIEFQNKLLINERELNDLDIVITDELKKLTNSINIINIYRNYYEISLSQKIITNYEHESKITEFVREVVKEIKDLELLVSNDNDKIIAEKEFKSIVIDSLNEIKLFIIGKKLCKINGEYSKLLNQGTMLLVRAIIDYENEFSKINEDINILNVGIKSNELKVKELNDKYITELNNYQELYVKNTNDNNTIEIFNSGVEKHNNGKLIIETELLTLKNQSLIFENKLPSYNKHNNELLVVNNNIKSLEDTILESKKILKELEINQNSETIKKESIDKEYQDYIVYQKNKLIWKIYSSLIKTGFKDIVFEYYRSFLNNTLNIILEDVNFKLMWNSDGELYMIDFENGFASYRPVQQTSGMETCFLGLTLIYAIHLLNIKNSISNIFIDELSGQLNKGQNLNYSAINYQELFVMLLLKFKDKTIMIVDHNINNLFESVTYEVCPDPNGSKFVKLI